MRASLRRQLFYLRLYALAGSLVLMALSAAAYHQAVSSNNLGEITVERINVVDANGTLRVVIANKDRMHPGGLDGRTINRPRPAGLIIFNDEGDEVGGLTYAGQEDDGVSRSDAAMMFDPLKQDQTMGFSYH